MPSECQTAWILIMPSILSALIWVQSCMQTLSADIKSTSGGYHFYQRCLNSKREEKKAVIFRFLQRPL